MCFYINYLAHSLLGVLMLFSCNKRTMRVSSYIYTSIFFSVLDSTCTDHVKIQDVSDSRINLHNYIIVFSPRNSQKISKILDISFIFFLILYSTSFVFFIWIVSFTFNWYSTFFLLKIAC